MILILLFAVANYNFGLACLLGFLWIIFDLD